MPAIPVTIKYQLIEDETEFSIFSIVSVVCSDGLLAFKAVLALKNAYTAKRITIAEKVPPTTSLVSLVIVISNIIVLLKLG